MMDPTRHGLNQGFFKRSFHAFADSSGGAGFGSGTSLTQAIKADPTEGATVLPVAGSALGPNAENIAGFEYRILAVQLYSSIDLALKICNANNDTTGKVWFPWLLPAGFGNIQFPLPGLRMGDGKTIWLASPAFTGKIHIFGVCVPTVADL